MNTTHPRLLLSSALLLALGFISGCESGPEIKYEADRTIDVTAYKTYALIPWSKTGGVQGQEVAPGASLKFAPIVTSSIKNALTSKGYSEAAVPQQADFAVNVRATMVPKTDVTDWGMGYGGYGRYGGYWGGAGYGGYNVTVDQYNEGVLRIEIFDIKKKDLVWVGWAKDQLYKEPTGEHLPGVIAQIMANFPPPPPAPEKK
jgi:hypothetical protein